MANNEYIRLLKQSAKDWNEWRRKNYSTVIDLKYADLSYVDLSSKDLSYANLFNADLSHANLISANFKQANLSRSDLSNADLTKANLTDANFKHADLSHANLSSLELSGLDFSHANLIGAKLIRTQVLGTDFTGAKFTSACLEDWNYNYATKLDNIECQYIYSKSGNKDRRPSSGEFGAGDFTKLYQKVIETVDLIFADGIDWEAFFLSFQELKAEYAKENLSVQALEKKSGDAFIIRLEVPPEANKAEIETQAKELYEDKLNVLEAKYHAELHAKDEQIAIYRQQNANLENVLNRLGKPTQCIINVNAQAQSKSMSESYQSKYDQRNSSNQFVDTAQSGSNPTFNQYNYTPEQKKTLADAASEIQKLLKQLEQTNPTATEAEKVAYVNDETTPSLKRRAGGALQAGSETVIDEFILDNKYLKVVKAIIKGWLQPGI